MGAAPHSDGNRDSEERQQQPLPAMPRCPGFTVPVLPEELRGQRRQFDPLLDRRHALGVMQLEQFAFLAKVEIQAKHGDGQAHDDRNDWNELADDG